ncbi:MAG TPA: N-acetylmuramic acid 6-phosphate etherase [Terriglobales bacterium]|nr:N-acetylmuramic acid 6-phosphate etherase [Terriglobales bacterium]
MKSKLRDSDLSKLVTEQQNPRTLHLDEMTALEIAEVINREDRKVADCVTQALPEIAKTIDLVAGVLANAGRLIYVGAGTSGRLGALDAAEIPPTFDISAKQVLHLIAGGKKALYSAVEDEEDSLHLGQKDIARQKPSKKDVVIGIAASGRTPYTLAALAYAKKKGARTVAVVCNAKSPLEEVADLAIVVDVGAEVLSGSTRMKAGTAQKMVLNMISTGAMVRLGYVYDNLMVNVLPRNKKLRERGITIVEKVTGVNHEKAAHALKTASGRIPVALVMLKTSASKAEAERALNASGGQVRKAIEIIRNASGFKGAQL